MDSENADNQTFDFTIFQSGNGPLSKAYSLQNDGSIDKSSTKMSSGRASRVSCTFAEFSKLLRNAKSDAAFCFGTHAPKYGDIVDITLSVNVNPAACILARSAEFYQFTNGLGILLLDHDEGKDPGKYLSPEEFFEILSKIHPEIAHAAYIVRGSLSSGVHRSNEEPIAKGWHAYLLVKNAADISRYGDVIFERLWLAGYGHIKLASNGAMHLRTISDKAVHQGCRLDYVGQPVLVGSGLSWSEPELIFKSGRVLDTSTLEDLNSTERTTLKRLQADAKLLAKPLAELREVSYTAQQVRKMVANGIDETSAKNTMADFKNSNHSRFIGDFPLVFDSLGNVTVHDVLANPQLYDQQTLADPVEGLEYGRGKAIFYWNKGTPVIHSFAHGKSIYTLGQPEEAKSFPGIDERPCFRVYSTFMKIGKKTFPPGVYMHGFKPGTEKKEPTLIDKCICGEFTLMLFLVIPMG